MSKQGYVKFTGEYNKLKGMGYEFQKLYASNYMQWCKDHFRVWKKGSDITHDEYDLYKLISFLQTNPKVKTYNDKEGNLESITFYKFRDSDDDPYAYYYGERNEENDERYGANMRAWSRLAKDETEEVPLSYDWVWVKKDTLDFIQDLKDNGLYELVEYTKEELS